MTNRGVQRIFGVAAVTAASCACAYEVDADLGFSQKPQEIINGTVAVSNSRAVAIYARGTGTCTPEAGEQYSTPYNYTNMWWPRPCSGYLVRRNGSYHYTLTARHCVTKDGTVNGPIITNSADLRTTGALNPGVLATQESNGSMVTTGSPPSYTVTSTVFSEDRSKFGDLAIVRSIGNLSFPNSPAGRTAIMGYKNSLRTSLLDVPNFLRSLGYGRTTTGTCYGHASSGAGVLRLGSGWSVTDADGAHYFEHDSTSDLNQALAHGDSGGGLYFINVAPSGTWLRLVGVNGGPSIGNGGPILLPFLQKAFGYVHLVALSESNGTVVVGAADLTAGAVVSQSYYEDSSRTQLTYEDNFGKLKLGGLCIADEGVQANAKLRDCSLDKTSWSISASGIIKNISTQRCLKHSTISGVLGTTENMANCTTWTFVADNAF